MEVRRTEVTHFLYEILYPLPDDDWYIFQPTPGAGYRQMIFTSEVQHLKFNYTGCGAAKIALSSDQYHQNDKIYEVTLSQRSVSLGRGVNGEELASKSEDDLIHCKEMR